MPYAPFSWRDKPIHPDIGSLLLYREGQLPADLRRAVERHLAACSECQLEQQRLTDAWVRAVDRQPLETVLADDSGQLARLMAGIDDWESAAVTAGCTVESVTRHVAGDVEKYLGA